MFRCRMDKILNKFAMPKAKTFSGDSSSLDFMVRESMFFVWPGAGFNDGSNDQCRNDVTKPICRGRTYDCPDVVICRPDDDSDDER